jgi:hypothetical protein
LYWPHVSQAWCFTLVAPQAGQASTVGNVKKRLRRRLPERTGLVRFFGVAMGRDPYILFEGYHI